MNKSINIKNINNKDGWYIKNGKNGKIKTIKRKWKKEKRIRIICKWTYNFHLDSQYLYNVDYIIE